MNVGTRSKNRSMSVPLNVCLKTTRWGVSPHGGFDFWNHLRESFTRKTIPSKDSFIFETTVLLEFYFWNHPLVAPGASTFETTSQGRVPIWKSQPGKFHFWNHALEGLQPELTQEGFHFWNQPQDSFIFNTRQPSSCMSIQRLHPQLQPFPFYPFTTHTPSIPQKLISSN